MNDNLQPVRIWDLPTRAFHWSLAACIIGSIISAYIGGNAMVWHLRLGYAVFTLLAFRVLWGFAGGRWSRFANFIYSPATVLRYLRGQSRAHEHHEAGHNPLGALSVFGLLALLAAQVGTGLFADDEIATTGPLNKFVSTATGLTLTYWHKNIGQRLIVVLVLLHILAILFYLFRKKQNLIRPMLTGDKQMAAVVPAAEDSPRSRSVAAVLLALCAAGVAWVVSLGA